MSEFTEHHGILCLGLDWVGKTTILRKLKLGEIVTTVPTIGFTMETLQYESTKLVSWVVGGGDKVVSKDNRNDVVR